MNSKRKIKLIVLVLAIFLRIILISNHNFTEDQRNNGGNIEIREAINLKPLNNDIYTIPSLYVTDHIWSPDGSKIAYITAQENQTWLCDLWVADWDPYNEELATNLVRISTEAADDGLMDWKIVGGPTEPQEEWILYTIDREDGLSSSYYGARDPWRIRPDGTGSQLIVNTRDSTGVGQFCCLGRWHGTTIWAKWIARESDPDYVYFRAHDGNGWFYSFLSTVDGTSVETSVSSPYNAFRVAMSPNGRRLLFGDASYFGDPVTFYARDLDGTLVLSGIRGTKYLPWEYGTFLVLADEKTAIYNVGGSDSIWAIDISTSPFSNDRLVLDDAYYNEWANYNPIDGQELLMRSNRSIDGNMHIFRIQTDGTGIIQLTGGPYNDYNPIMSPDGQFLSYRRLPEDYAGTEPHPYELVVKGIGEDTTSPTWDEIPSDQIVEFSYSFTYDVNASDLSGIDSYWVNDTVNFQIDGAGVITNVTNLSLGTYWLKIYAFDNKYNNCSINIKVTIKNTAPVFTTTPDDFSYEVGMPGNNLLWSFSDISTNNPTYTITRNNLTLFLDDPCTHGVIIEISVDGLSVGLYCYIIEINDGYDGTVLDVVWIEVKSRTEREDPYLIIIVTSISAIGGFTVVVGITLALLRKKKRSR